jgi:hypothetical protein
MRFAKFEYYNNVQCNVENTKGLYGDSVVPVDFLEDKKERMSLAAGTAKPRETR